MAARISRAGKGRTLFPARADRNKPGIREAENDGGPHVTRHLWSSRPCPDTSRISPAMSMRIAACDATSNPRVLEFPTPCNN